MTGAKIGGQDLGISTKQVIIDTGTSYTLMPKCKNRIWFNIFS